LQPPAHLGFHLIATLEAFSIEVLLQWSEEKISQLLWQFCEEIEDLSIDNCFDWHYV
jgi:hypothetical protein